MVVGLGDYHLQSADFQLETSSKPGSGMQIDLNKGRILGYDFELKGEDSKTGSFFHMSSDGSSYFQVHHVSEDGKQNLDIVNITKTEFTLQSQNWSSSNKTGTQLKLDSGKITSYKFDLYASNSKGQTIHLDSTATTTPFNVNDNFKLNWDGSFQAAGGAFKVEANGKFKATQGDIGPFHFDSNRFYTGSDSFGDSGIWMSTSGDMSLGRSLKYENSALSLYAANITKAAIKEGTISDADITKGTITNATITKGTIKNCDITTGMTLSGADVKAETLTFLRDFSISFADQSYGDFITKIDVTDGDIGAEGIVGSIFGGPFLKDISYYKRFIGLPKKLKITKYKTKITTLCAYTEEEGTESDVSSSEQSGMYVGSETGPYGAGQ